MKRLVQLLFISILAAVLSGCSFLGEVNNSLDYINEATAHIETLNSFAEEAPELLQEAVTDSAVQTELEEQLLHVKTEIEEFIQLTDIPSLAEELHADFVQKNEALLAEINTLLDNGNLVISNIENSELFTTIQEANELFTRIEDLGL
ncbi:DUF6376 family protein [Cytobacillus gottheilii]|uniref:DUF6376 family protein n=1 Tax=Cytobacillus gottheilii TaxID=859144 RepID=UPI0008349E9A|nr:DUF6376 family protein [Cytobacillus gottheilii]